MARVDFLTEVHTATKRDYLARVNAYPKAEAAKIAKQWGYDYWDGDRKFGYGGNRYDGRWRPVAERMAKHYGLRAGDRVLDVGCGKGFLAYDLTQVVPGLSVVGFDISEYALGHAKDELRGRLVRGTASALPFASRSFDLVLAINTLHNFRCAELEVGLREVERVSSRHKFVCMDSYRTEEEKVNLLYWQLTCECFFTPDEWEWWFRTCRYTGDWSFIFFE